MQRVQSGKPHAQFHCTKITHSTLAYCTKKFESMLMEMHNINRYE